LDERLLVMVMVKVSAGPLAMDLGSESEALSASGSGSVSVEPWASDWGLVLVKELDHTLYIQESDDVQRLQW
jgi:hypothetical protein